MILFTADWHIKLGQKNVPKDWAIARYRRLFKAIDSVCAEQDVSTHIIGGDLFDRLPSLEELKLYFEFVSSTNTPTIIFDGNHEATKKNHTFFTELSEVTQTLNDKVTIVTNTRVLNLNGENFGILPYCDLHKKGSIEELPAELPIFTHVRGEIPPHVKPEVDLDRFKKFPIVFAGDLHAHSNSQRNIVYPGSPVTTSFHRSEVETGYILINHDTWKWHSWEMPQLIRKTVNNPEEMVPTEFHHTIYELEGDLQELSNIENSELLDKKVVKRSTEVTLELNKEMSIHDELAEYLLYVLELPEEKVHNIVGTFNDYSRKTELE